ncbi:C-5 cytosine-specific DNA methylase [Oceanithermus profundus DSM 14977]|uniref:DNA (cytosine-5-)-methyltransferase n=1 Tax=Oceanithermus profundus (strain DSM 14977 / NBRC 100410 / VKM B-2274 / 506) TaxID=670487 RepID=E4U6D3_OCEP5|nr:DNA cytosine methyltransferase [Oceanithermus profundus]ADR35553.1 C-5 cytosine-specific DNA methylase [Oceanithermus profundus DSM 14977]
MRVIDLYAGMGGISWGFSQEGFHVTGLDINPLSPDIFELNGIGKVIVTDLRDYQIQNLVPRVREEPLVLVGGPSCRPWSNVNRRRHLFGPAHPDYVLMIKFLNAVTALKPEVFLMENVLPIASDPGFRKKITSLKRHYWVEETRVRYSEYGAPTSRVRFFAVGFRRGKRVNHARSFLRKLDEERRRSRPRTAGDVLADYVRLGYGEAPDHHWPNFRTINRYEDKYRSNRYGWYRLDPEKPAPSFGNVMKTYTLPPWVGNGHGVPLRVISVREAMALIGFDRTFRFPEGASMKTRYQMVADAVSPVFSRIAARAIREILEEEM